MISTSLNKGQSSSFGSDVFQYPGEPAAGFWVCEWSRGKLQAGQCPKQRPKPRNVFSSVERRQPVSKGLRETATCSARAPCLTVPKELRETACGTMSKGTCLKVQGVAGNCNEILKTQQLTTRLDNHNLQVTDYGYVEKVFTEN